MARVGRKRMEPGTTAHEKRMYNRYKEGKRPISKHEVDWDLIDMKSKNTMWTDAMSRSIFINQGTIEGSHKAVREPLRM